jgi:hypothetical protein
MIFRKIPREWNLELRTYSASRCQDSSQINWKEWDGRDGDQKCLGGKSTELYQSGGYGFISDKGLGEAWEYVQPNALVLVDGTKYNLTAMGENAAQLLGLGSEVRKEQVPPGLQMYEIKAKDSGQ